MIKRTIEISQQPVHLTVRNRQLLILRKDDPPRRSAAEPEALLAAVPCEDIGLLLVENQAATYTHAALIELLAHDAAVVVCGRDHLPVGLLLPLAQHSQVVWRINDQLAIRRPLRKQLWRQLVQAKIRAQAANLLPGSTTRTRLLALARQVRSGDPTNVEAQAARAYWPAWRDSFHTHDRSSLPGEFHRDPDGPPPNNLLNYGYAVVRAAVARAIVAAGLLPAIGIHHHQRSNAFCLADDLVEPLRPLVDDAVRDLVTRGHSELTPPAKRALLELLTAQVRTGEQTGPLMVGLHRYVASFVRCLTGEAAALEVPVAAGRPC